MYLRSRRPGPFSELVEFSTSQEYVSEDPLHLCEDE
jgi:hypothetical protein